MITLLQKSGVDETKARDDESIRYGDNMSQHRNREPSLKLTLLIFIGGAAVVAASLTDIYYRAPLGYLEGRGVYRVLGLGLIAMLAPVLGYFRKKKS